MAALGERFFTRLAPTALPSPYVVSVAPAAAALLGWDDAGLRAATQDPRFVDTFAGNADAYEWSTVERCEYSAPLGLPVVPDV